MTAALPTYVKSCAIFFVFLLAVLVRAYALSDGSIFFYYDQARDGAISRSIVEQLDIKIQGPSVSGTGDSVYHGVLFYYVIGPLYTLAQGSPVVVAHVLALFGSLSVFVVYQLGIDVFSSKHVGLLAAFFVAVSAVSTHQHIWISNPQLNSVLMPLSYVLLWRIFLAKKRTKRFIEFLLFGVVVACSMQAALQSVVVLGSVFLSAVYVVHSEKSLRIFTFPQLFAMVVPFVLGISSMLLTEVLLWKNGILQLETLRLSEHAITASDVTLKILERYAEILRDAISPSAAVFVSVTLLLPILYFLFVVKKAQAFVLGLMLVAPLWLLVWHYRDPPHTFIGLEVVFYLAAAVGLWKFWQKYTLAKIAVGLWIVLFVAVQFSTLLRWHTERSSYYGIQRGALLSEQVALISKTYEVSGGESFTFSTLTSPFAINTTWSFLYDWFADSRLELAPTFVGMSQAGYPGDALLPESTAASSVHFTIIEPDTTLSASQISEFELEQTKLAGAVLQEWSFGTLRLQLRGKQ